MIVPAVDTVLSQTAVNGVWVTVGAATGKMQMMRYCGC